MSRESFRARDRMLDLLADAAVGSLDRSDRSELERLRREHPDVDDGATERAAAAVDVAITWSREADARVPEALERRLMASAEAWIAQRSGGESDGVGGATPFRPRDEPRAPLSSGGLGWLAAAACLLIAAVAWWPRVAEDRPSPRDPGPIVAVETPAAVELRDALALAPGAITVDWTATEDPAASSAGGEVVWDPATDRGFMTFRGLEPNDPSVAQYQLWVFDEKRDERFPVDGGVFDIPEGRDEVVVPIDPKLEVGEATLFAVTVEPPGGVVVSDRERIVLVAQPPGDAAGT